MPASWSDFTICLNSSTCSPASPGARVLVVRREVADRIVAPVVPEPEPREPLVVDELMHGHQLDRRHAELLQGVDHHRVREPRVRAAKRVGHLGVKHRQPLDVRFVDDGLVPRACAAGDRRPTRSNGLTTTPRGTYLRRVDAEPRRAVRRAAPARRRPSETAPKSRAHKDRAEAWPGRTDARARARRARERETRSAALDRSLASTRARPAPVASGRSTRVSVPSWENKTQLDAVRDAGKHGEVGPGPVVRRAEWGTESQARWSARSVRYSARCPSGGA